MRRLIKNIASLVGVRETPPLLKGEALADLPILSNAYLIVEGSRIAAYGPMEGLKYSDKDFNETIDITGQTILPSWCDSHTH
ncbi:MAG: imidazolonepropionase, partial [Flaviaesturariibacter sp.]|nr:imidazolonepropionase [Flaviaesturariibacter sp.]